MCIQKQHQTALRTTHERESKQNTKTKNAKELVHLFKLLHKSQRITNLGWFDKHKIEFGALKLGS